MKKSIIIVLGMHRSGTSAIAKGIIELGAHAGNNLMKEQEDNPKGFWEDERIVALNDDLLKRFNLKWYSIDNPSINRFSTFLSMYEKSYLESAKEIINDIFLMSDVIVIKDPRMSILLPFWQKVFGLVNANVKYIVALRNPLECAKSLNTRNDIDIDYGLKLWLYYNSMLLKNIKSDFLVCSFSSLLNNPMNELSRISKFTGCHKGNQELEKYCTEFLDPSLKHHNENTFKSETSSQESEFVDSIFSYLNDWTSHDKLSYEDANKLFFQNQSEILNSLSFSKNTSMYDYSEISITNRHLSFVSNPSKYILMQGENTIHLTSDKENSINQIHLKPSKYACILKINAIKPEEKDEIQDYKIAEGNYNYRFDNIYIFNREEAEILIEFSEDTFSNIDLNLELYYIDSFTYYYLTSIKKKSIEKKNEEIEDKNEEIERLISLQTNLQNENATSKQLIMQKNAEIEELSQWGVTLDKEVEELRNQLCTIYNSRGWRVLLKLHRMKEKLIPADSKRQLVFEMSIYFIRRPKQFFKALSFSNAKLFFKKLSTNSTEDLLEKVKTNTSKYENRELIKKYEIKKIDILHEKKLCIPEFENIDVSIIIPAYNQFDYNIHCINSIIENTKNVSYEIILVDDVSTDETSRIENYVSNIRVIRNKENQGFLKNCNDAAKSANGEYILLLNNDTQVEKDWLLPLVELMKSDEKIGMVGSKLVYPDGRLQEAGGIIWNDASGWNYGRLDDPSKSEYNYVREVDYISGASIMTKKTIWEEIGGFDERYVPAYYEDTDFAFEVRKRGYKVMYQPKSEAIHFEGISHGTDSDSGIKSYQKSNKKKFHEKWKTELANQLPNGHDVFHASNRSAKKKTILVIDRHVPHFDKNAGSKCTFHYIKLFKEMGLNVIFLGDDFYPHAPYTGVLQQMGINVLYGNWYYKNYKKWIKDNGKYLDFVYLNRPHISIKYIDLIKEYSNAKIIYFGHDLHYLREMRNYEIVKDTKLLKESQKWEKIERELFHKADVVYAVGGYEQKIIQDMYPNKTVRNIPVYIYEDVLVKKDHGFQNRKDIMFVGGFNHKPNVDAAMWFVKDIFPLVKKEIPDIKFYIIGSKPTKQVKELASNDIVVTGFVSDEELEKYYNKCKIAVAPLRFGAGMKGKVIEAMYFQIPMVTTSIGGEGLPDIEKCINIADDPSSIANSIVELYKSDAKCQEMAKAELNYIKQSFTCKSTREIISSDFT